MACCTSLRLGFIGWGWDAWHSQFHCWTNLWFSALEQYIKLRYIFLYCWLNFLQPVPLFRTCIKRLQHGLLSNVSLLTMTTESVSASFSLPVFHEILAHCKLSVLYFVWQIVFYEDRNFQGRSYECKGDTSDLHSFFSRCNSAKVKGGSWVLYESPNYMGYQYILVPGEYPDYHHWIGFNDYVRSCRLLRHVSPTVQNVITLNCSQ